MNVGDAVRNFMQVMGQPTPDTPQELHADRWELRQSLIREEYKELQDAWLAGSHADFLDACVDLVYVVVGTAVEAGLPFDEAFKMVHAANMAKLTPCADCKATGFEMVRGMKMYGGPSCGRCKGAGGHPVFRDDGKVLKPVGWQAPDIASILEGKKDAPRTTTGA